MDFPDNAMDSFSDREVVYGTISSKKIYNDLKSKNPNNPSQEKSKFKLCISFSGVLDGLLDGKMFGVSCSPNNWNKRVKYIEINNNHYVDCRSTELHKKSSIYIPSNMEFLLFSDIHNKIKDNGNGFKYVAEIDPISYKKIVKLFAKYLEFNGNPSESVKQIRRLVKEIADISVLRKYGVDI